MGSDAFSAGLSDGVSVMVAWPEMRSHRPAALLSRSSGAMKLSNGKSHVLTGERGYSI